MDISQSLVAVVSSATFVGVFHTLAAPDHYLPFATIARLRGWSFARTMRATFFCGLGHLLSSLIVGVAGIALGSGVGLLERIQDSRGGVVNWIFFAFALAYFLYGLKLALFSDTTEFSAKSQCERDGETEKFLHSNGSSECPYCRRRHKSHIDGDKFNFWVLFSIFVFGPCEVLVPLMMYPASHFNWIGVLAVALAFTIATTLTMLSAVAALYYGFKAFRLGRFALWGHASTGAVLLLCSALMFAGA